ncbi:hypothetical protein BBK36DRAFT_1197093 [Trichoderma citrinoviride]|uniref:Fungal specific transcription factor n=1 Tax=Trichoderma citrinoviride TaxID=58853 RepID=A0A2T4BE01_9HYPO|nr:hypothetical protein BBK36DRAFT_1197093 [Trichoderma citrinoviride]PTB67563.1 hypothetical protein BBK36DRAFT_1197093 [Trichoderma citrinoviride]
MLRRSILTNLYHHFKLKPSHRHPLSSPFSTTTAKMSSTSEQQQPPSSSDSASTSESTTTVPRNALPAPDPSDNGVQTLDVSGSGSTVKLDHLGPLVVNADGTMSRIANWDKMADIERENTLRILGKRNQERLAALREARGISEGSNDSIGASGNHDTSGKQ